LFEIAIKTYQKITNHESGQNQLMCNKGYIKEYFPIPDFSVNRQLARNMPNDFLKQTILDKKEFL